MWNRHAAELACVCEERMGNTLAAAEYLDGNQGARFSLEETTTDRVGRVFTEINEVSGGYELPYHIVKFRRDFMCVFGDFPNVTHLLRILSTIVPEPGFSADRAMRQFADWCGTKVAKLCEEGHPKDRARAVALMEAQAYFKELAPEDEEQEEFTHLEDWDGGNIVVLTPENDSEEEWLGQLHRELEQPRSYIRKMMIHDPTDPFPKDWVRHQSDEFRAIYFKFREIEGLADLMKIKDALLFCSEKKKLSLLQLKILWSMYKGRREVMFAQLKQATANAKPPEAVLKMIASIQGVRTLELLTNFGQKLFNHLKDRKDIPPGFQSRIWDAYRERKEELGRETSEIRDILG